ncbi:winged helix DNA-binding protein [Geomicrobium sediminis]|uniref:DNA-binding MarR family transcriptional regulator n=1 Tax=Geomicrobium sediminis TaxID=1347788 RepID=A0ABS2PCN7_9BACL|nr:DNA-binding MarR family transcriptional regulator [Geomicrobium sediminis]
MYYQQEEQFRYHILAMQRAGNRELTVQLKELDLTPSQAEVLTVLNERSMLTLKEIGQHLICETGSPSRLVNTLVKNGLVEGKTDEQDQRARRYRLSNQGKQKCTAVKQIEDRLYKHIQSIYTEEELKILNQLFTKYIEQTDFHSVFRKRSLYEGDPDSGEL